MRIGLVCPYSISQPGGVQSQVLGLRRAFAELGEEAVVIAPCDREPREEGIFSVGRSISLPANGSIAPISLSPLSLARTRSVVLCGAFDVLHLHEPLAPGPTWAALEWGQVPLFGTFHRTGASMAYRVVGRLGSHAIERMAWCGAVSEEARATACEVLSMDPERFEVVPNAVEVGRFAKAGKISDLQSHGVALGDMKGPSLLPVHSNKGPVVLFIGRHEERKGLEVLLAAWASLFGGAGSMATCSEDEMRPSLLVSGSGPQTGRLKATYGATEGISWLGRLEDEELVRVMGTADVVVAPSLRGESFGVVLLEALSAGAVVVASDLPGYRSVLGDHGMLVPPGNPGALARALDSVLEQVLTRTGLASPRALAASMKHAERYSMHKLAVRYLELYKAVGATD